MAWPVETRHGKIPRHSRGTGVVGGSAHPTGDRWLPIFVWDWHRVPGTSDGFREDNGELREPPEIPC